MFRIGSLAGGPLGGKLATYPLLLALGGSAGLHFLLIPIVYRYLREPGTAIAITALEGMTGTLAILPVYDLAARGTPRGSEALGYSVMMSVWNLTNSLSDWVGSTLFTWY